MTLLSWISVPFYDNVFLFPFIFILSLFLCISMYDNKNNKMRALEHSIHNIQQYEDEYAGNF